MVAEMRCHRCNRVLRVEGDQADEGMCCPHCGTQVWAGNLPGERRAKLIQSVNASGSMSSVGGVSHYDSKPNSTNVNLALSAAVGVVLACTIYLVVLTALKGTYVNTLLAHRGWVQYVIILLACWGAAILLFKRRKVRRQRASLLLDLLPVSVADRIRPDNAGSFRKHIRSLRHDADHNFLIKRILKVLDRVEAGSGVEEATDLLKAHAEIDACSVQSSYTILKVIIWAIPIFGFLGTVIGIGAAVQKFPNSLKDVQLGKPLSEALVPVTTELATAFDTTLLALLMSLVVMFPTSCLEKREDDRLISIDEYCHDYLLNRLDPRRAPKEPPQESFTVAAAELLSQHRAQQEAWLKRLSSVGKEITNQVSYGWAVVHQKLCEANESSLQRIQDVSASLARDQMQLTSKMRDMQAHQIDRFQDMTKVLTEGIRVLHQQTHQECMEEMKVAQATARQLSEAISGVKDEAKTMQAEMGRTVTNYHEVFGRLTQVCHDLTQQVVAMKKRLAEAETLQQSTIKDLVTQLAQERALSTKAAQDQVDRVAQVQQQAITLLARHQEKLSQEIRRSSEVQQKVRDSLVPLTELEGLDGRLTQMAKILRAIGVLIKQSNGHVITPNRQAIVPLAPGGGPRRGFLQRLRQGGGNGSH